MWYCECTTSQAPHHSSPLPLRCENYPTPSRGRESEYKKEVSVCPMKAWMSSCNCTSGLFSDLQSKLSAASSRPLVRLSSLNGGRRAHSPSTIRYEGCVAAALLQSALQAAVKVFGMAAVVRGGQVLVKKCA